MDSFKLFCDNDEYRRICRQCVFFAKAYTYDTAQAECMAEEAMIILWKRLQEGEQIERLMPFLFATVRNLALNYLKHKQADIRAREGMGSDRDREIQLRLSSLSECDPSKLYQADIREIIDDTLKHLGERTETIFRLSRFQGLEGTPCEPRGLFAHAVVFQPLSSCRLMAFAIGIIKFPKKS